MREISVKKSEIPSSKSETNPKNQIPNEAESPVLDISALDLFRISNFVLRISGKSGILAPGKILLGSWHTSSYCDTTTRSALIGQISPSQKRSVAL
jgi:hypothetical protein